MEVGFERFEHRLEICLCLAAAPEGVDDEGRGRETVQHVELAADVGLVEQDGQVEHLLDPGEHQW